MEKNAILKKCKTCNDSNDILYYIVEKKEFDVYAVVCAPCNYLFQNDAEQFFGSCIYMSEKNLNEDMRSRFPCRRDIRGITMRKVCEKTEGGKKQFLDNSQIRELPFLHRIDAEPRFESVFIPSYTCYDCADVIDIIDPRTVQLDLYGQNDDFRSFIDELKVLFDVKPEQMGLTGSASLSIPAPSDYDIVFYGDKNELRRIDNVIAELNRKRCAPKASGLSLPFRFMLGERVVDTLLVDTAPDLPRLHAAKLIRRGVPFSCRVTDDRAAFQVEPILIVDSMEFSYVIIIETFFHAAIRKGDMVEGVGDLVLWEHDGKEEYAMLLREPFSQLKNFTRYFTRNEQ